jgi:hypothetical protein
MIYDMICGDAPPFIALAIAVAYSGTIFGALNLLGSKHYLGLPLLPSRVDPKGRFHLFVYIAVSFVLTLIAQILSVFRIMLKTPVFDLFIMSIFFNQSLAFVVYFLCYVRYRLEHSPNPPE